VIEPVAQRLQQGTLRWPAPAAYVLGEVAGPVAGFGLVPGRGDSPGGIRCRCPARWSSSPPRPCFPCCPIRATAERQTAQHSLAQWGLLAVPFVLDLLLHDDPDHPADGGRDAGADRGNLPPGGTSNRPLDALKSEIC
jgi:hypothetical protein